MMNLGISYTPKLFQNRTFTANNSILFFLKKKNLVYLEKFQIKGKDPIMHGKWASSHTILTFSNFTGCVFREKRSSVTINHIAELSSLLQFDSLIFFFGIWLKEPFIGKSTRIIKCSIRQAALGHNWTGHTK